MSREATSDPSGAPPAPPAALELRIAGRAGPTFALDATRDNTLGRAQDAAVVLADRLASRAHAAVRFMDGVWTIHDLGSRNGTWVDGGPITSQPLLDGSVIRIGAAELVFRLTRRTAAAETPTAMPEGQLVKCGPMAQLEGSVLRRSASGSTDDARRPLLLYQASLRLLASRSVRDVIGTTLELAAEHCGAASVGWFDVRGEERFEPVCVVPPGTTLARLLGESTCRLVAREGNAVWVAADGPDAFEVACVPIIEAGAVRAALAASAPKGGLRSGDFDFLVALASLAAAAHGGHARAVSSAASSPQDLASLQTVDLDAGMGDSDDAEGTIALDAAAVAALSIDHVDVPPLAASPTGTRIESFVAETGTLKLDEWQRLLVIEALRRTGGSLPSAAAALGISRPALHRQLEKYGLINGR